MEPTVLADSEAARSSRWRRFTVRYAPDLNRRWGAGPTGPAELDRQLLPARLELVDTTEGR